MGGRCRAYGKLTASKNLSDSGILASPTAEPGAFLNLADCDPNDLSQSSSDLAAAAVATEEASALQLWSRSNLCLRYVRETAGERGGKAAADVVLQAERLSAAAARDGNSSSASPALPAAS